VAALLLPRVVLFGEVLFERDVQLVFVRAVASGAAPLWDPHVAFGHPMLANPNTQVLYPPTWLNLILDAEFRECQPSGRPCVAFAENARDLSVVQSSLDSQLPRELHDLVVGHARGLPATSPLNLGLASHLLCRSQCLVPSTLQLHRYQAIRHIDGLIAPARQLCLVLSMFDALSPMAGQLLLLLLNALEGAQGHLHPRRLHRIENELDDCRLDPPSPDRLAEVARASILVVLATQELAEAPSPAVVRHRHAAPTSPAISEPL
jgi:hypothetical protein